MSYIIVVKQYDKNLGNEEFDGGPTLATARKEAAFFVEHLPKARIRICVADTSTDECRLITKEIVQHGEYNA